MLFFIVRTKYYHSALMQGMHIFEFLSSDHCLRRDQQDWSIFTSFRMDLTQGIIRQLFDAMKMRMLSKLCIGGLLRTVPRFHGMITIFWIHATSTFEVIWTLTSLRTQIRAWVPLFESWTWSDRCYRTWSQIVSHAWPMAEIIYRQWWHTTWCAHVDHLPEHSRFHLTKILSD